MRYWLMKSEPEVFSIDDLARPKDKTTGWDGVRNYQARNFLKSMRLGDMAFFYHSNASPSAVVGTMKIVYEAYPDPTQFDRKNDHHDPASTPENPRWFAVDVEFQEKFKRPVTLEEIRGAPALRNMTLLKRGRLSVQPVTIEEWSHVLAMGRRKA